MCILVKAWIGKRFLNGQYLFFWLILVYCVSSKNDLRTPFPVIDTILVVG